MSAPKARLLLASDPSKAAPLDPKQPLTIGKAPSNRLCLASQTGVSDHHAVVRFSQTQGWLVCEWQSNDGTFHEGQRIQQCRQLEDGDEIRLGLQGPVLQFKRGQGYMASIDSMGGTSEDGGRSDDWHPAAYDDASLHYLEGLSERDRDIVMRHTVHGESLRSIGADYGVSGEAVRLWHNAAMDQVREAL